MNEDYRTLINKNQENLETESNSSEIIQRLLEDSPLHGIDPAELLINAPLDNIQVTVPSPKAAQYSRANSHLKDTIKIIHNACPTIDPYNYHDSHECVTEINIYSPSKRKSVIEETNTGVNITYLPDVAPPSIHQQSSPVNQQRENDIKLRDWRGEARSNRSETRSVAREGVALRAISEKDNAGVGHFFSDQEHGSVRAEHDGRPLNVSTHSLAGEIVHVVNVTTNGNTIQHPSSSNDPSTAFHDRRVHERKADEKRGEDMRSEDKEEKGTAIGGMRRGQEEREEEPKWQGSATQMPANEFFAPSKGQREMRENGGKVQSNGSSMNYSGPKKGRENDKSPELEMPELFDYDREREPNDLCNNKMLQLIMESNSSKIFSYDLENVLQEVKNKATQVFEENEKKMVEKTKTIVREIRDQHHQELLRNNAKLNAAIKSAQGESDKVKLYKSKLKSAFDLTVTVRNNLAGQMGLRLCFLSWRLGTLIEKGDKWRWEWIKKKEKEDRLRKVFFAWRKHAKVMGNAKVETRVRCQIEQEKQIIINAAHNEIQAMRKKIQFYENYFHTEEEKKKKMQTNLKDILLRGVCSMNVEALELFGYREESPVDEMPQQNLPFTSDNQSMAGPVSMPISAVRHSVTPTLFPPQIPPSNRDILYQTPQGNEGKQSRKIAGYQKYKTEGPPLSREEKACEPNVIPPLPFCPPEAKNGLQKGIHSFVPQGGMVGGRGVEDRRAEDTVGDERRRELRGGSGGPAGGLQGTSFGYEGEKGGVRQAMRREQGRGDRNESFGQEFRGEESRGEIKGGVRQDLRGEEARGDMRREGRREEMQTELNKGETRGANSEQDRNSEYNANDGRTDRVRIRLLENPESHEIIPDVSIDCSPHSRVLIGENPPRNPSGNPINVSVYHHQNASNVHHDYYVSQGVASEKKRGKWKVLQ